MQTNPIRDRAKHSINLQTWWKRLPNRVFNYRVRLQNLMCQERERERDCICQDTAIKSRYPLWIPAWTWPNTRQLKTTSLKIATTRKRRDCILNLCLLVSRAFALSQKAHEFVLSRYHRRAEEAVSNILAKNTQMPETLETVSGCLETAKCEAMSLRVQARSASQVWPPAKSRATRGHGWL